MDLKYGRVFTESDVRAILEQCQEGLGEELPDILEEMDANGVRFKWDRDEPVFVLRGRDRTAEGAVRWYRDRQRRNAPVNFLDGIDKAVAAFHKFRTDHSNLMKDPD